MFCVHWVVNDESFHVIHSDMGDALKVCEVQRKAGARFVSLSSEIPDNVTKMGVADPSPDYNWKKRRV